MAVGTTDGPDAGLAVLADVEADGRLATSRDVPATRADLLRRPGRTTEAARAYREAADRAGGDVERRFLERRLAELGGSG